MKKFLDQDFLLKNETAKTLYHDYAKDLPIYDYHCHLSPKEIAEDKSYKNLAEIWLGGDHYKWRVMRSNGVSEDFITGSGDDYLKFMEFAKTVPLTIGNPMYHWTHLELQRYFGIDTVLNEKTAPEIWEKCNALLSQPDFSAKSLITKSNVEVICTTDDPIDSLEYHKVIAADGSFKTKVLPTFRPDKGINIHLETFLPWLKSLVAVVGYEIKDVPTLFQALTSRIDHFHSVGCRLSDHALDAVDYSTPFEIGTGDIDLSEATVIFEKALSGEMILPSEITYYKSVLLNFFGKEYAKRDWVMQLHIGALRNNSRRMYEAIGADTGFDSINDTVFAANLSALMNDLDHTDELPKTIIYTLNPRDNYVIGTMIGNFQGGGIKGKIQFGSGWWFCDQKEGMIDQMKTLASLGLISRFVGMLTDSRSFLSYTRHEYFRRILCNMIGQWVEEGEYPDDMAFLGQVVADICINNARE
jgi:glucuronate isomerase